MPTLVGRIAIKDLANIARADTRYDGVLDQMREHASRQAEEICGRQFSKISRVELHPSYNQFFGDPSPQYIIVNAPPIDQAVVPVVLWAPFDDHDTNGTPLTTPQDWRYELDNRGDAYAFRVQRLTSVPANLPIPPGAIGVLGDSPTGFQVTYTGGYAVSATGGTDPLDIGEEDVVEVPVALGSLIAQKLADDFKFFLAQRTQAVTSPGDLITNAQQTGGFGVVATPGLVRPWTEAQMAFLLTFARKDMSWIGPYWSRSAGRAVGGK